MLYWIESNEKARGSNDIAKAVGFYALRTRLYYRTDLACKWWFGINLII